MPYIESNYKKIAVIIPIHNGLNYTQKCLQNLTAIHKSETILIESFRIIVVDDGSTDGSKEWIIMNYPEIVVLHGDGNLWWSGAINMGAKYAIEVLKTEYILLWNNDIRSDDDYFQNLIKLLDADDRKTIYGSKIKIAENKNLVWSMGGIFNPYSGKYYMIGYYEKDDEKFQTVTLSDWLPGMGTLIPTEVIDKIGYWNAKDFPQYHGDSDYTYRAKINGFDIKVLPELIVYNHVKKSGLNHNGTLKGLLQVMTDVRSKINFRKNLKFYCLYAKTPFAYVPMFFEYFKIFGGFFKWKILSLLGIRKKLLIY
jgi:GT2 family glycosyltransferase